MFRVKIYKRGSATGSIEFKYVGESLNRFVKGGDEDMVFDASDLMELDPDAVKKRLKRVKNEGSKKMKSALPLYPEDTIEDLKNKIFLTTGHYPFQQHLWAEFRGAVNPLSYKIKFDDKPISLDILAVENHKTLEGIPIDEEMYGKSLSISVDAMDKFVSIADIIGRYGSTINMAVLDDYLTGANIREIVKDRQQTAIAFRTFIILYFPMLNYEAFSEYVQTRHLRSNYPLLMPPKSHVEEIYEKRGAVRDFTGFKKINMAVSSSAVGVYSSANVNIRNLFDELVLDAKLPYCQAVIWKDRRRILLEKTWNNIPIKNSIKHQNLDANTITIVARSRDFSRTSSQEKDSAGMAFMQFIIKIREDGRYTIKTHWPNNMEMSLEQTYKTVEKMVNPIIIRINALGGRIFGHDHRTLELMTGGNSYFLSLNLSFYWPTRISTAGFGIFLDSLKRENSILGQRKTTSYDFVFNVGALKITEHIKENLFEYGNGYAYLFDMNYRERLSILDKYGQINLIHRATDVKFEVSDLQEHLLPVISMFLSKLCGKYARQAEGARMSKESAKLLRTLKEKDPNLYDYGRVFNKKKLQVYSIKCQKKHQPLYIDSPTVSEVKQAREDKRKGVEKKMGIVQYYNFTTDEPAYYKCPNPKFPYLRFVTGVHPKGFCLPCCQKSSAPVPYRKDEKTIKARQQRECMDTHTFTDEKLEPKSRYIMVYGKSVDPNRLAHLPESSLAPLMRTETEEKFYIYGVPQSFPNLRNVGILHSYAILLNRPVKTLVEDIIITLRKNTNSFELLLSGKITNYFENMLHLINEIRNIFILNQPTTIQMDSLKWNNLFISIATRLLGLNTIKFVDEIDSLPESITLYIPTKVKYYTEFFVPGANALIIEKRLNPIESHFYPIILADSKKFFNNGIINQRTFDEEDLPMIRRLLRNMLKPIQSQQIDLYFITSFVDAHADYELIAQHLGYLNYCYAVTVAVRGYEMYIPVAHSQPRKDLKIREFPGRYTTRLTDLLKYFKQANLFIKRMSKGMEIQGLYPYYKIGSWLEYHNSIVGFTATGLNFYIKPISSSVALKTEKNAPFQILLYHPSSTNTDIDNDKALTQINKLAPKAFYSVYSHQLVVLQFAIYFRGQKNTTVRGKIKKHIGSVNLDNYSSKISFMSKIHEMKLSEVDNRTISRQLQIMTKKDALLKSFESETYDFDMIEFENLRELADVKKVSAELHKIAKKIFEIGRIQLTEFPNIITGCSIEQDYCERNKLIIDQQRLDDAIEILSSDIINPLKEHSVFYMPDIILNYYSFHIRPREEITIEFI